MKKIYHVPFVKAHSMALRRVVCATSSIPKDNDNISDYNEVTPDSQGWTFDD